MREAAWRALRWPGFEHARVDLGPPLVADVLLVGMEAGRSWRLRYRLSTDAAGATRELRVHDLDAGTARVLAAPRPGHWELDGAPAPDLDGCLDVDVAASALTNTLPVRRLRLREGQGMDLAVAYVDVPGLAVSRAAQRYTRDPGPGAYTYRNLDSGFHARLTLDGDDLVQDYEGVFTRVA